jgi:hypothetical protein
MHAPVGFFHRAAMGKQQNSRLHDPQITQISQIRQPAS